MIDLTNRGSRCLYHVRLFRDLYISAFRTIPCEE
nr:MAG TPA: hypothetical protein [Caudoviricetes sp.]